MSKEEQRPDSEPAPLPTSKEVDEVLEEEGSFWSSVWGAAKTISATVQRSVDGIIAPAFVDPDSSAWTRTPTAHESGHRSSGGSEEEPANDLSLRALLKQSLQTGPEVEFLSSLASRLATDALRVLKLESGTMPEAEQFWQEGLGQSSPHRPMSIPVGADAAPSVMPVAEPVVPTNPPRAVAHNETPAVASEAVPMSFNEEFRRIGGVTQLEELVAAVEQYKVDDESLDDIERMLSASEFAGSAAPRTDFLAGRSAPELLLDFVQFLLKASQQTGHEKRLEFLAAETPGAASADMSISISEPVHVSAPPQSLSGDAMESSSRCEAAPRVLAERLQGLMRDLNTAIEGRCAPLAGLDDAHQVLQECGELAARILCSKQ